MDEKGRIPVPLPVLKPIVAAVLGIIIFLVVFEVLKGGGVDPNLSAILAVAAGFGSIVVVIRLPFG